MMRSIKSRHPKQPRGIYLHTSVGSVAASYTQESACTSSNASSVCRRVSEVAKELLHIIFPDDGTQWCEVDLRNQGPWESVALIANQVLISYLIRTSAGLVRFHNWAQVKNRSSPTFGSASGPGPFLMALQNTASKRQTARGWSLIPCHISLHRPFGVMLFSLGSEIGSGAPPIGRPRSIGMFMSR